jgi:hypothetical protein
VNGRAAYLTECDCKTKSVKKAWLLVAGKTKSCGCLRRELSSNSPGPRSRHGFAPRGKKGREYTAWLEARSEDPNTPSFETFLTQVGSAPASDPRAVLRRQADGSRQWRRGKKLTIEEVREIRALRDAGFLHKEIARQFAISKSHSRAIVNFQVWKD